MHESILFVDDEKMVLNALSRTFYETNFTTYFAQNAADGIAILHKEKIDMVVSDIRMLPVSGFDFLKEVREMFPGTIRVILSAFGERQMMLKAICVGLAKMYMMKPWDNLQIVATVTHIFKLYTTLSTMDFGADINRETYLPTAPALYSKIQSMIASERDMKDIALCIETDPSCCANILKLINSSFYGMSTSSIHQAMVYLGINNIKDLVLVAELFKAGENGPVGDLQEVLKEHLIVCSYLLHGLHQRFFAKRLPEDYSSLGFLADLGRLFMLTTSPQKHEETLTQLRLPSPRTLIEIEESLNGFSHMQLVASLMDWWNFPSHLVDAGLHHHSPEMASLIPSNIICLTNIADFYAWKFVEKIESGSLQPEVFSVLDTSEKEIDETVRSIYEEYVT